ncbi:RNA methyltransferase [Coprobacter tertius]|uniref:RNA methyltransferase n=1 Tax=Coprobacter tertius TaxID=2944915 RepID=A0ABT1MHV6_9BACT|nr:RNA methyltransferase [Coprobacter tertius]MCP9612214.1 RNA methyltransferase [Coprobacter tertius]
MLGKNKIKYIQSLAQKKARMQTGCFVAEGNRLVNDTIGLFDCELLVATQDWLATHQKIKANEIVVADKNDIEKASLLRSPQDVIAVYRIPSHSLDFDGVKESLSLVLDTIQDPGNLGTIVRLADWYGIEYIFCSPECADIYNPKTVQATMGAISRVKVLYLPLKDLFEKVKGIPVYGTFLDGNDIYSQKLSSYGMIVMGNEGNGISNELEMYMTHKLFIPNYPYGRITSESLNVGVATAIVCAEFRRRQM